MWDTEKPGMDQTTALFFFFLSMNQQFIIWERNILYSSRIYTISIYIDGQTFNITSDRSFDKTWTRSKLFGKISYPPTIAGEGFGCDLWSGIIVEQREYAIISGSMEDKVHRLRSQFDAEKIFIKIRILIDIVGLYILEM